MIDSLFWFTGAAVWVFIWIHLLFLLPIFPLLAIIAVTYRPAKRLDDRYYDDSDDVEAAREEGTWYYYVIHYLFLVAGRSKKLIDWYVDRIDPVASRLPLFS